MQVRSWVIGVLGAAAIGLLIGGWHPWNVKAASSHRAATIRIAQALNPTLTTWSQAHADAPTLVRKPGWVPSGITQQHLYREPHGVFSAFYTGSHGAWTIMIQENEGAVTISSPNQTPGTLAGIPVLLSEWQANSGAHLSNVSFRLNGNTYDVNGINTPLAVAEHVAASLISP